MVAIVLAGLCFGASCTGTAQNQAGADEAKPSDRTGELRIGVLGPVSADPATLNPTRSLDVLAADLLYDGLTRSDQRSPEAQPALASSWDTTDGINWTFHLGRSRKYSDGSPVTAASVVASLERVRGLKSTSIGGSRFDIVAGFTAPSDDVVGVTLTSVDYELPMLLADPTYGIVPFVAAGSAAPVIASQTVYSGRFKVKTGGPDGATLAAIDGTGVDVDAVEFVHFDDATAAATALRSGKIDIAPLPDHAVPPQGSTAVTSSAANLVLEVSAANGLWKDPATHRALLGSIDRAAVATATSGDPSATADDVVPGSILTPGQCATSCAPTQEGLAALKAIGATSGPVHVDVPPGAEGAAAGAELVRQLVAAGLPAEVRPATSSALQTTVGAGQLELALFATVGLAPTPDPYLAGALSSVGPENLSGFASAEFDAGLAAARANPDATKRRAAYVALESTAMASAPVIPLVALGERFAISKRVHGIDARAGVLFDGASVSLSG